MKNLDKMLDIAERGRAADQVRFQEKLEQADIKMADAMAVAK